MQNAGQRRLNQQANMACIFLLDKQTALFFRSFL
ncbi:hypothetical protein T08_660 [Trichinella sp. T8]|nr:hypothetical protein T08_660 [Trichinella sp. T8]